MTTVYVPIRGGFAVFVSDEGVQRALIGFVHETWDHMFRAEAPNGRIVGLPSLSPAGATTDLVRACGVHPFG